MTPNEFIAKWHASELKERSAAQEHFVDLCGLLGEPTPADADPKGDRYCFERGALKDTGSEGCADVWKRHCFAWEYRGKHANLDAPFNQLRQYALALENPILWTLGYPDRLDDARQEAGFDPVRDGPPEFEPVREEDFPLFRARVAAGRAGGELPVAFNAANEVAVERFLSGDVGFRELADVVLSTLQRFSSRAIESIEDARRVAPRPRAHRPRPTRGFQVGRR